MTRIFYGWVVVGGAFLVLFTAYGSQYAFGVFFSALLDEFGWSRARLSGVFSLYTFLYCSLGLLAGWLTDRWGPRTVIALGGLFLGGGLVGMSQVFALWQPYLFYGVVAGIGMSTAYVPCTATVAKWFVGLRGLALGVATSGGSLGTFALPVAAAALVSTVGWRTAYVVFGTGVLVILNLAALVMKRDPELLGLTPEGERGNPSTGADPGQEIQWPFRRAVRTLGFWMLFGIYTATWIPVFVPFVHAVPLARDLGISPLLASTVVSVLGIAAFFGRVIMGAASDRIGRRAALAISLTLQALAFLGFAMVEGLLSLYLAGVAFGFSYGAISTLFPAMVSDFFGRTEAGSLVGFLFAMAGSTGAVGPVGAGWIYDTTGSYTWAFVLSALTNVVGLVLLSAARPPGNRRAPRPERVPPSE
jgi:MFS family permease